MALTGSTTPLRLPAVVRAIDDAVGVLQGGGAKVAAVALPDCDALIDGWAVTCGVEAARAHAPTFPSRKDEYGPALTGLLELGLRASSADYDRLERARTAFRASLDDLLQRVDVLVAPCIPGADSGGGAQRRSARAAAHRTLHPLHRAVRLFRPSERHAALCRGRRRAAGVFPADRPAARRRAAARHRQRLGTGSQFPLSALAR